MVDIAGSTEMLAIVDSEEALWIALQICDSGFPGGSFAHSLGLESALHHKLVTDASCTLDAFVTLTLEQACAQLIPLACAGHKAYFIGSAAVDLEDNPFYGLMLVDSTCHISLTNEVARRASSTQGANFFHSLRYVVAFTYASTYAYWCLMQ